jgi:hypothetical protein
LDSSTSRKFGGLFVALAFCAIYLLWPTKNYYWDGIAFAVVIERAQHWYELFNVHHLLYEFFGAGLYRLVGGHVRALYLMQWANSVIAAVLLVLAYQLFRRLGVPAANSLAWTAVIGAAATFWKYATDADSYIIANIFLVLAFLLLVRERRPRPVLIAALHIGAMMFHQLAALFYPVALFCLWRQSDQTRRLRNLALYGVLAPGVTLAIYAWAFRSIPNPEAPSFIGWLTFHAKVPFFFNALNNAVWMAKGTLRLFVGGKVGRFDWTAPTVVSAVLLVIAVAATVFYFVRLRPKASSMHEPALILWAGVYLTFLFFWEPYNTFYRQFYVVPLVAMLALLTRKWDPRLIAAPAAALLLLNFTFYIYPNTLVKNNPPLAVAMEQRSIWRPGTGVVFGQFVPDLWTISYFNPQAAWIPMDQPDSAMLRKYVADFGRDGGSVWVDWTYQQRSGRDAPPFTFRRADELK